MVPIPLQQGWHLQQAAADFISQADHRAELWHREIPLQSTHLCLGPWAHPSSCQGHPAVLVPASPDVAWKEWLGHWLSRLKFGSWMPVLFMQTWHVSLSWAMWPRFQPLYLQNITHVHAPPSSPWFQRDYSHVHAYPGLCRAGANPAAFSWFTPHSGEENLTQEQLSRRRKSNPIPPLYSPSTFPSLLSLGQPAGRSAPLCHQGIAAY